MSARDAGGTHSASATVETAHVSPASHRSARLGRVALAAAGIASAALMVAFGTSMRATSTAVEIGAPAPDFELVTYEGESLGLRDLRGRWVVLNFWASWCVECDLEAADIERLWQDFGSRGVTVVGVAYTDTEPAARAYLERHGLTYPNGPDLGGRISRAYALKGVPETVLIDPNGLVAGIETTTGEHVAKLVGAILPGSSVTPDGFRRQLEALVSGSSSGAPVGRP